MSWLCQRVIARNTNETSNQMTDEKLPFVAILYLYYDVSVIKIFLYLHIVERLFLS